MRKFDLYGVCLLLLFGVMTLAPRAVLADWATDSLYKTNDNGRPYMLYVPPTYDPTNSYPLVLFLHGGGGEGDDNVAHVWNGAAGKNSWVARGDTFVIAPQGPVSYSGWVGTNNIHLAYEVMEDELPNYNINTQRLYVTGLSRGGRGTFNIVAYYPHTFAASAPLCGWSDNYISMGASDPGMGATSLWAHLIIDTPMWIHHGDVDDIISPTNSVWMFKKIGQAVTNAGRVTNTNMLNIKIWPGVNHGVWVPAYNDPALNAWMFDQWIDEHAPPGAATDVSAFLVEDNCIGIMWNSTNDPKTDVFDIYRNGVLIDTCDTAIYTNYLLEPESNYSFQVCAKNHRGMSSPTTDPFVVSTVADYQPPRILSVDVLTWDQIQVGFTESVETQLTANPGNFSIDGGITLLDSTVAADQKSVILATTPLSNGTLYTLTIHNAEDLIGRRANDLTTTFQHNTEWSLLPWEESFETMSTGTYVAASNGWIVSGSTAGFVTSDSNILYRLTNDYSGNFPIPGAHTKVLQVNHETVSRSFAGVRNRTNMTDFMLEPAPWPWPDPPHP